MSSQHDIIQEDKETNLLPHHKQFDLCRTRLPYRQGRNLTAVKTYTVCSESTHLLVFGVPKVNLRTELKCLAKKYGKVTNISVKEDYPVEEFTECFHINYDRLQSARYAKKRLDTRSFYGGSLHVCYAPELETIEETRAKLIQRRNYLRKHDSKHNTTNDTFTNIKEIPTHQSLRKNGFHIETYNSVSFENYLSNQCSSTAEVYINEFNIQKNNTSNLNELSEDTADVSENINGASNCKRPAETLNEVEYVFKSKRRKMKKSEKTKLAYAKKINMLKNMKEEINNPCSSKDMPVTESSGNAIVLENSESPKIITVPKKPINKIILNIKTKLI